MLDLMSRNGIRELTVLHANIHTLASLGRVCLIKSAGSKNTNRTSTYMDRIACEKDPFIFGEFGTDTLPNLISCPPITVRILDLVRRHDFLGAFENHLRSDL
jgi:hypothetical protein